MIRTRGRPWRDVPNPVLTISTLAALAVALAIPFSPLGDWFGFRPPPHVIALAAIVAAYLVCAELFKPLAIANGPRQTNAGPSIRPQESDRGRDRFPEQAVGVRRKPRPRFGADTVLPTFLRRWPHGGQADFYRLWGEIRTAVAARKLRCTGPWRRESPARAPRPCVSSFRSLTTGPKRATVPPVPRTWAPEREA